jgi:hypothetical protein
MFETRLIFYLDLLQSGIETLGKRSANLSNAVWFHTVVLKVVTVFKCLADEARSHRSFGVWRLHVQTSAVRNGCR